MLPLPMLALLQVL
jgi:hypothetical protein